MFLPGLPPTYGPSNAIEPDSEFESVWVLFGHDLHCAASRLETIIGTHINCLSGDSEARAVRTLLTTAELERRRNPSSLSLKWAIAAARRAENWGYDQLFTSSLCVGQRPAVRCQKGSQKTPSPRLEYRSKRCVPALSIQIMPT
jgi:hypothetical protein